MWKKIVIAEFIVYPLIWFQYIFFCGNYGTEKISESLTEFACMCVYAHAWKNIAEITAICRIHLFDLNMMSFFFQTHRHTHTIQPKFNTISIHIRHWNVKITHKNAPKSMTMHRKWEHSNVIQHLFAFKINCRLTHDVTPRDTKMHVYIFTFWTYRQWAQMDLIAATTHTKNHTHSSSKNHNNNTMEPRMSFSTYALKEWKKCVCFCWIKKVETKTHCECAYILYMKTALILKCSIR